MIWDVVSPGGLTENVLFSALRAHGASLCASKIVPDNFVEPLALCAVDPIRQRKPQS